MDWLFGILGGFSAFICLLFISFVQIPPINFGIFKVSEVGGGVVGTNLFIGNLHIHHYFIGIILVVLGLSFYYFKMNKISWFLIGFGAVLIVDQLPNLITGQWEKTLTMMIIGR